MHARQGRRIAAGAAWAFALVLQAVTGSVGAQPARDAVSDSVGATFGEFRVDETGNASYTIPIYAPPGTAGVAPKIALTYNSGWGNGWIGRGWSLSGLSSITRCRKTREAGDFIDGGTPVDGNSRPVSYSNQDAFCLDGARLLLVSGAAYGADGAEYRLETDPFTKITSVGGNNGGFSTYTGPNSFVVRRKDGSTSYYGNTSDSRIMAVCPGAPTGPCSLGTLVATWAINRFEDSTGNYIDYTYTAPTFTYLGAATQYLPASITWTGKRQLAGQSTGASAPYAGIYFHHQFRVPAGGEDASSGFQGGAYFVQDQKLVGIERGQGPDRHRLAADAALLQADLHGDRERLRPTLASLAQRMPYQPRYGHGRRLLPPDHLQLVGSGWRVLRVRDRGHVEHGRRDARPGQLAPWRRGWRRPRGSGLVPLRGAVTSDLHEQELHAGELR
jgi:hypothetical protein